MKKKITILSIISFLIIVIDRVVKIIVNKYIPLNKSISVIKNVFYLTNVHNEGAAFSIMTGLRYILIFLSVAFLIFIIYYMYKKKKYLVAVYESGEKDNIWLCYRLHWSNYI